MSASTIDLLATAECNTCEKLLDLFHSSAANANLVHYFGCFYDSKSRFLGTDASENWTAPEFIEYSKPHFDAGSAWTYTPIAGSRRIEVFRDSEGLPLFAAFDELLSSESFGVTSRGSGSLIFDKISSNWFITAYHLTFPVPNDLAGEICKKISIYEKKQSYESKNKAADAAAAELLAELEVEESVGKQQQQNKKQGKKGGKK
jgi:hypothetical protein